MEKFQLDCARLSSPWNKPNGEILLSFTTDPYQPIDETIGLTRQAIKMLKHYKLPARILTKGGKAAERDMDLLGLGDWFGVTLTFINDADSVDWEPYASLPQERIKSLEKAKKFGIKTWVSLEPVIDPEQSLELIDIAYPFVDKFMVGKWNHDVMAKMIDWREFGLAAIRKIEDYGISYYVKEDLQRAISIRERV